MSRLSVFVVFTYFHLVQVVWGTARVSDHAETTFDFLSSTYGGYLPADRPFPVVDLSSIVSETSSSLGCALLPSDIDTTGKAVLVARGGCRFDEKAFNIQQSGASMVIIYDPDDNALQRLGGLHPMQGYVEIPAVMVSPSFVEAIHASSSAGKAATVVFSPVPNSVGFDKWVDVAYTEWSTSEDVYDQLLQIEGMAQKYASDSPDIERWLRRRAQRLQVANKEEL